jgi:hypothetical protein
VTSNPDRASVSSKAFWDGKRARTAATSDRYRRCRLRGRVAIDLSQHQLTIDQPRHTELIGSAPGAGSIDSERTAPPSSIAQHDQLTGDNREHAIDRPADTAAT